MCFGLRGLSLRTTLCLAAPFWSLPLPLRTSAGVVGFEAPFCLRPIAFACCTGLKPFTFGAMRPAGLLGVTLELETPFEVMLELPLEVTLAPPFSRRMGITLSLLSPPSLVTLLFTPFLETLLIGLIRSDSSPSRRIGMILSLEESSSGIATCEGEIVST